MRQLVKSISLYILIALTGIFFCMPTTLATNSFQIIPEPLNTSQGKINEALNAVNNIYSNQNLVSWNRTDLWSVYNEKAKSLNGDLWAQIKTGMFTRESLLNIASYIIRFLMQIAMVIWAWFIIYGGYRAAMIWFGWGNAEDRRKSIKNIIVWTAIIAFSYTIIKLLVMAFLS